MTFQRELILILRKDLRQQTVIGLWLARTCVGCFALTARFGNRDSLLALRGLFLAVVIIKDGILIAIDFKIDLREVHLKSKIMFVVELLLRMLPVFRELKFDVARCAKSVLKVATISG